MNTISHLYIDLDAIAQNARQAREAYPELYLYGVLKANAYGLGELPIARTVAPWMDGFAVATVEEARVLSEAALDRPILCFGYVRAEARPLMVERGIRPVVFSVAQAQAFDDEARKQGKKLPVHVAIDTGHSRIGFLAGREENRAAYRALAALPHLMVEGAYSHLSTSDEADGEFTEEQTRRFRRELAVMREEGLHPPICHLANSAALLTRGAEVAFNGARLGDVLYGLYTSPFVQAHSRLPLHPAIRWETRISYLKEVPAGTGVSYGQTWVAPQPTRLATLQIGYADGYPRALSNRGEVLIHGRRCPIRGRICMDQMMVDVSEVDSLAIGDPAILYGTCPETGACIDHFTFEAQSGTILQETLVHIPDRVGRVYEGGTHASR